ncbi:MAG: hypothetical protein WA364_03485 [Candidatus Nitrosopolaris sp.]
MFTTVVANSSKKLVRVGFYVSLSNTTVPTNAKRIKTEGGMAEIVRIMCVKVAADYMRIDGLHIRRCSKEGLLFNAD